MSSYGEVGESSFIIRDTKRFNAIMKTRVHAKVERWPCMPDARLPVQ